MPRRPLVLAWSAALLLLTIDASPASAGTWSGQTYRNGIICASGVPLVSWDIGGGHFPAFFTTGVAADSFSQPPLGATPTDYSAATDAGPLAALITRWGDDASAQRVGEVSYLVAQILGTPPDPTCLDAAGQADAASLWQQAQKDAGPYRLSVIPPPTPTAVGRPAPLEAQVLSALGYPVAGASVTFPGSVAVTNANGIAHGSVTVPASAGAASAPVSVSVAVPTLKRADAAGAVPVVLASPEPTSASATVSIDTSANPAVAIQASSGLSEPKVAVDVTSAISGLNGHIGDEVLQIAGPLPMTDPAGCAQIADLTWRDQVARARVAVTTIHTQRVTSGTDSFTPTAPGCYAASATLTALAAVPAASARSPFTALVAVLATQVNVVADGQGLAQPGPLSARITVGAVTGVAVRLRAALLGPVTPGPSGCVGRSWSGAPRSAATVGGDASVRSAPVRRPGCYTFAVDADLSAGALGRTTASSTGGTVLVLTPYVTFGEATTWTPLGGRAQGTVVVSGTFGQAAQVHTDLRWVAATDRGCRASNWTGSTVLDSSPLIGIVGDTTLTMDAAPATRGGCYTVVPVVTMLANPAIRVTGTVGAPLSIVQAAEVETFPLIGGAARVPPNYRWPTRGAALLYLLAASAGIGWVFLHSRRDA